MHQDHPDRPRHLSAVPDHGTVTLPRATRPVSGQRVTLTTWQRMETEQARELVDALGAFDTADLTPARLAFAFGRLHGMAANLLDILDAITTIA